MKNCYKKLVLISITFLVFSTTVYSDDSVDFIVEASLQTGGEDLATFYNVGNNSDSIRAGEGASYLVGVNFNLSTSSYIKLLAGTVNDSVSGTVGTSSFEFDWNHMPINLLYMMRFGSWNFGGGIAYHINPKLKTGRDYAGNDISFDNTLGLKIGFDYLLESNVYFGLEYTAIDYKVNTGNTIQTTVSGNSFGIVAGYVFDI